MADSAMAAGCHKIAVDLVHCTVGDISCLIEVVRRSRFLKPGVNGSLVFEDPAKVLRKRSTGGKQRSSHRKQTTYRRLLSMLLSMRLSMRAVLLFPGAARFRETFTGSSKTGLPFTPGFKNMFRQTISINHGISPTLF